MRPVRAVMAVPGRPLTMGILGGMGPMATVEAFRRITLGTPGRIDQDHLHVIVDSDSSIIDRTDALVDGGPSPLPALSASAERLTVAGADILCMPCKTAHAFFGPLQAGVPVPIVHMLDETAAVVASRGLPSLRLLATAGTVASGVYQDAFLRRNLAVAVPDVAGQRQISEGIAFL